MTKNKSWYNIQAKGDSADVIIYDEIGFWGITAKQFIDEVKDLAVTTINLHLNTPGGSVFDGTAIFNVLKNHQAKVIAHVDGLAASIGSFIAMAADEVQIASNAFMMIHDPIGVAIGGSEEMESMANLLDKMADTLASAYAVKSGKSVEDIRELMAAETWFTGQEAVDTGIADVVTGAVEAAANFDFSKFNHVPEDITKNFSGTASERALELALRDAGGLSRTEAKTVLSEGYSALGQRDAGHAPQRDAVDKNPNDKREVFSMTLEELKAKHPATYEAIFKAGVDSVDVAGEVAKAHTAEVARVADVNAQAIPGFEKEIAAMVEDGKTTGNEAAAKIVALQRAQMNVAKDGIAKDADGVQVPEAPTGPLGADTDPLADLEGEELFKAEFASRKDIRAEYVTEGSYVALRKRGEPCPAQKGD